MTENPTALLALNRAVEYWYVTLLLIIVFSVIFTFFCYRFPKFEKWIFGPHNGKRGSDESA